MGRGLVELCSKIISRLVCLEKLPLQSGRMSDILGGPILHDPLCSVTANLCRDL